MQKIFKCISILFFLFLVGHCVAQDSIRTGEVADRLKVFLEGDEISDDDFDYLRNIIDFADFVNDPKVADVHIIIIREQTGSGGYNYSVWFNGNSFNDLNEFTLNTSIMPGETIHRSRELLGRTVIRGIMPFFNEVDDSKNYKLTLKRDKSENFNKSPINDKWRNWVFKLSLWGGYNYEDQIKGYNYITALKADKVTDKVKIKNYLYLTKDMKTYQSDGNEIEYRYIYNSYSNTTTYSLSDHWSIRSYISPYQNTYYNQKFTFSGNLAAEFNIFPWDISEKKILSMAYAVGFASMNFYELTVRNKMSETLPVHKLNIRAKAVQPWGEITTTVVASQYLTDLSLYRLSLNSVFSFRITKGISFDFSFIVNEVHDEIYTSARRYSIEDVILGNIDLPSTIEISSTVGLTFRFGSIYNNVVNNRL